MDVKPPFKVCQVIELMYMLSVKTFRPMLIAVLFGLQHRRYKQHYVTIQGDIVGLRNHILTSITQTWSNYIIRMFSYNPNELVIE